MESILTSIKKLLGIAEEHDQFDVDIILHINSALMTLRQLGVGPQDGYMITGDIETWYDYLGDTKMLEQVKTYVYLKVKMVFDSPTNSFVLDAMNRQAQEYEFRLNVEVDKGVAE